MISKGVLRAPSLSKSGSTVCWNTKAFGLKLQKKKKKLYRSSAKMLMSLFTIHETLEICSKTLQHINSDVTIKPYR